MPVFHTQFRIKLQKEESVIQWLKAFQNHSKCTYRVTWTYKPLMKQVKYKIDMYCQHFKKKLTDKQFKPAVKNENLAAQFQAYERKNSM